MTGFITGATGFIGYAVSAELARAGHKVYGLARSSEGAKRLSVAEVRPVFGDMRDPESYLAAAREAEVLIHCAAEYSAEYMSLDRRTVQALLSAAASSGLPRLMIYTSGCWLLGDTGPTPATETTVIDPLPMLEPRAETERIVLAANRGPLRTIVLRPGCVYGGSGSLTAAWFESAATDGAARIVGDGDFHWTMIHLADLATVYRLAAESDFGGELFNVSDSSRHTVMQCARAVSQVVAGTDRVVTTPVDEAERTMGPVARCLTFDQQVDSSKARTMFGWTPRHAGFVDGIRRHYEGWKGSR